MTHRPRAGALCPASCCIHDCAVSNRLAETSDNSRTPHCNVYNGVAGGEAGGRAKVWERTGLTLSDDETIIGNIEATSSLINLEKTTKTPSTHNRETQRRPRIHAGCEIPYCLQGQRPGSDRFVDGASRASGQGRQQGQETRERQQEDSHVHVHSQEEEDGVCKNGVCKPTKTLPFKSKDKGFRLSASYYFHEICGGKLKNCKPQKHKVPSSTVEYRRVPSGTVGYRR
eukprot:2645639-Prymnesium_polylepis.2